MDEYAEIQPILGLLRKRQAQEHELRRFTCKCVEQIVDWELKRGSCKRPYSKTLSVHDLYSALDRSMKETSKEARDKEFHHIDEALIKEALQYDFAESDLASILHAFGAAIGSEAWEATSMVARIAYQTHPISDIAYEVAQMETWGLHTLPFRNWDFRMPIRR